MAEIELSCRGREFYKDYRGDWCEYSPSEETNFWSLEEAREGSFRRAEPCQHIAFVLLILFEFLISTLERGWVRLKLLTAVVGYSSRQRWMQWLLQQEFNTTPLPTPTPGTKSPFFFLIHPGSGLAHLCSVLHILLNFKTSLVFLKVDPCCQDHCQYSFSALPNSYLATLTSYKRDCLVPPLSYALILLLFLSLLSLTLFPP